MKQTEERKYKNIISFLLTENKVTNKTLSKLLKIDPDFDMNTFVVNSPIKVKYILNKQSYSKYHISVDFPFSFKLKGRNEIYSDLNIFYRNLDDVVYIREDKKRSWGYVKDNIFFHVKYKQTKQNKSFEFVLNSKTSEATNFKTNAKKQYFIDGVDITDIEFKTQLRLQKFSEILTNDENLKKY